MESIYFLSGTMCNKDLWQYVFPAIKQYNPVYIDISAASSFDEVHQIIDSEITTRSVLIGFSLGGFCAMDFTSKHPEKIKKLIVIAAHTKGLSLEEIQLRQSTISFLETHPYRGISTNRIQQFLHPKNHQNSSMSSIIKKMDNDLGKEVLIKQLKATSQRVDITSKLKAIDTPILLIGAREDKLVSYLDILALRKVLKKGSSVLLKNCGHMIPLEKPKELTQTIHHYLNVF